MAQIQGIINTTPDSFSDGGEANTIKKALKKAEELINYKASILDIGGEASGPNSQNISVTEEIKRVTSVIKAIKAKWPHILISIDTCKAQTAEEAIIAGADIINDITAMRYDPKMVEIAAKYQVPIILMYNKDNSPRTTIEKKHYKNIIQTITDFFIERITYAKKIGVTKIILDPGMGHFISSDPQYSFEIIKRLKELKDFFSENQLLIGLSRKSFIGGLLKDRDKQALELHYQALSNGADIIRVHNAQILETYQPLRAFLP